MANDEWRTPLWLLDTVVEFLNRVCDGDRYLTILDPCYSRDRPHAVFFARDEVSQELATKYDARAGCWSYPVDTSMPTPWSSHKNIWCNPPYSQPLCAEFTHHMIGWANCWTKHSGFLLINSSTSARHYQDALKAANRILFFNKRIGFVEPSGVVKNGNRNASTLFYFGDYGNFFEEHFERFGMILKGEKDER